MALPVPTEYPLVPVVQYDPMVPPCIPAVTVRPSVQHILPMICSAVCNEAGMRSVANVARLFCYNLLVNNHWHNDHFSEVVKLTADLVAKNYEKGHLRMPESGVQEAANQVLTLYTSNLLFIYPDMKGRVSPQVLDAAYQNVPTFNTLKQEIFSMYTHTPAANGYPPVQGYPAMSPGMQPYPGAPMPGQMAGGMSPGMHPGMMPGQMSPQQMQMIHQQQMVAQQQQMMQQAAMQQEMMRQQAMMQQGGYGHHPQMPQQGWANNQGGNSLSNNTPGAVVDSVRQDRFFTRTMGNPQPEPVQAPAPQPVPQPVAQPKVEPVMKQQNLEIEKGSEMERAKHQITFMGDMYSMDSLARSTQYQASVDKMSEETAVDGHEESFCVQESVVVTSSLEEAIILGRMQQHKRHKDFTDFSTFRHFVSINPPMFANQEVQSYMKALSKSTSFATMVVKMKSMASSLESKKKEEAQYTVSIISFLKQIDNIMTKLVNNFLSTKLRLKLSIDSFVEDGGELDMYLLKKYGQVVAQGFSRFETETINTIFENNDATLVLGGTELPENMHFAALSIHHSVTYLFLTDRELGYKITEGTVAIQETVAPTLYKIARSLQRHKKEMDFSTLIDVLITADGVRYLLSKNYSLEEEYLISRF